MSAGAPASQWQNEGYVQPPPDVTAAAGPYEAASPSGTHDSPTMGARHPYVHGTEREYLLTILLTVGTLGIYHFYYHFKAHDELCQQLGRSNDIKPLFLAYVGVAVLAVALFAVGPLAVVGALVLLGFIVVRQYAAIADARQRLALAPRGDATYFLLWNYLGALVLVGPFIAYYNLVHNYNDIWITLRHGGHLDTDAQAGAVTGTDAGVPEAAAPRSARSAAAPTPAATEPAPAGASAVSFSLRARHEPEVSPGLVEQAFQCPRCQTHVSVRGTEGESVDVRCGACGAAGQVRIGD